LNLRETFPKKKSPTTKNQEGRMPFYNFLSDEERRLFTTKPKEVTA
jgi:hypothetical protein